MRPLLGQLDVRVSAVYGIVATLWIILSDGLLSLVFADNSYMFVTISLYKGLGFVVVTTLALFAVLSAGLRKRDRLERALQLDITERKQIEQTLRESEEKFRLLMESAPEAIILADKDGRILRANVQAEKTFGYALHEMVGQFFEKLIPERFHEAHVAHRANFLASPGPLQLLMGRELTGRRKDGSEFPAEVRLSAIETTEGLVIASFLADITERKRVEEALRLSEERFSKIFRASPIGIALIAASERRFIDVNHRFAELTGYQPDEIIGRDVIELGLWDRVAYPAAIEETLFEQGVLRDLEMRYFTKSGEPRASLVSMEVMDLGNQPCIVVMIHDITERKQAEQQMFEAERLRVEIEKERELIELKERFISVVSHEFRTPLSVIMSSAELLERYFDRMSRERQLDHVREVLSQSEFMVGLLNDVLTINKARAGRLEFNPAPLDLMTFCQGTLERIQAVDKSKHKFVFTHDGDLSQVVLDAKLLQHILVNLLSNAAKYSPDDGEVHFEVTRPNNDVVFRVSDQGIGIPPESQARLFEPFHRANNVGSIGGTGLGLAIVKESVDLHRGTISCESAVGVGTTFTVRLPAAF